MNCMIRTAIAIILAITPIAGCSVPTLSQVEQSASPQKPYQPGSPTTPSTMATQQQSTDAEQTPMKDQRVTLLAVGDIMVHEEQLQAAWNPKQQSYQFQPFFNKIEPVLKSTDWLIGNLETTLAGSDLRYSGYPEFNTPDALATTLKQVGFTALTTANNHSMDRRETGVLRTLDALKKAGIPSTGTFRSSADRNHPLFLEKDGLKLAILAYTYSTNGIPIPKEKSYLVNLIQADLIKKDIATARQQGADLVAVCFHFGVEYQRIPNDSQRQIAHQTLLDGADMIIGSHPHVVQPYEWQTITDASGKVRKGLILYSLGNFISAQRREYKDVGAIAKISLLKKATGESVVEAAEMIPTYVHYYRRAGKRHYVIYPLAVTLAAKPKQNDPALTAQTYQIMQRYAKEMSVHLNRLLQSNQAIK